MKKWQRAISVALGGTMILSTVLTTAACNKKDGGGNSGYDTENRPLVLSSSAFDGNFNPFFATSGPDSEIAGQTQLPLMTIDKDANSICGPQEATVALDWKTTYKNEAGLVVGSDEAATTTYEFVIKNGIRFSDGTPLTIDDVLFNLYVYLDPMYSGSATIYSTDIQGLKAYRAQNPLLDDTSDGSYDDSFVAEATTRIYNLTNYLSADEDEKIIYDSEEVQSDLKKTKELFMEEITSDWTEYETSLTSYQEEYNFTEAWQVYFLNMGIVSIRTKKNSEGRTELMKIYEDPNNTDGPFKYVTDLEKDPTKPDEQDPKDDPTSYWNQVAEARTDAKAQAWITAHASDGVNYTLDDAKRELTKEYAIGVVYDTYTATETGLLGILSYWETASNLRTYIENEARSNYYDSLPDDEKVPTISGITSYKTSSFQGGKNNIALGDEHDVLSITINGVDPKAVYNFSFGVAPRAYYSNSQTIASTLYGVKTGNQAFFDGVLKESMKNGLPKGAGPYMASNAKGDQSTVDRYSFYANNIVYFERNPYFYTVGLDGAGVTKADIESKISAGNGNDTSKEIHNAKIKYLNYKVVGDERIVQSLQAQNIDYGQPNAEPKNVSDIAQAKHLGYTTIRTNGYGYVGVNPKYVPDLEVRQAIMRAMNTALTVQFYGENAEMIYRPISNVSWASPHATSFPESLRYTQTHADIEQLCMDAGWSKNDEGIFTKNGKKLELRFTIAGESKNHPAYSMFLDAARFLNECGFVITVGTDIQALQKLATGGLQVWAAAWQTGVDPDPYQTYHKDSTATSVKNWNYSEILDPNKTEFWRERKIVEELSDKIDAGRKTLSQKERTDIYADALGLIMDLAVELPTYQRKDLVAWNSNVIDSKSLNIEGATATTGVIYKIWQVDYNK
ncbi:MAG: hypothetical protein J6A46_00700 [Clostridia bacterium]|nr:hypothetical protein [Clostridia bacterium]